MRLRAVCLKTPLLVSNSCSRSVNAFVSVKLAARLGKGANNSQLGSVRGKLVKSC